MKSLVLAACFLIWAGEALAQDHVPPNPITDLSVVLGKTTAAIAWTSPADQCNSNTVAEYELRYSSSAITECNFSSGTLVSTSTPQSPGNAECKSLAQNTLTCNHTYYFAIRSKDSSGNWSTLSNVVTATTESCNSSHEVLCLLLGPSGRAPVAPSFVCAYSHLCG
jgi:hypothetical protein